MHYDHTLADRLRKLPTLSMAARRAVILEASFACENWRHGRDLGRLSALVGITANPFDEVAEPAMHHGFALGVDVALSAMIENTLPRCLVGSGATAPGVTILDHEDDHEDDLFNVRDLARYVALFVAFAIPAALVLSAPF